MPQSASSTSQQDVAYAREAEIVAHFRSLAQNGDLPQQQAAEALQDFCQHYERLLEDSKLLTSVGDRLQRKLKSANLMLREQSDEIKRINGSLQEKNIQLQDTVDELTRTKASRRATLTLLLAALVLMLFSEYIEYVVENSYTASSAWTFAVSWGSKIVIFFIFKPVENILERVYLKRAMQKREKERLAAMAAEEANMPLPSSASVPAVAPAAAGNSEAGAAAMSVVARKRAEAEARRAAEGAGDSPSV